MPATSNRYALAAATTVAMFATWGLAQSIHGSLSPQFERLFALNAAQTALTDSALGAGYLLLAIPAALLLRRLGYKAGVVFGLSGFSVGAFLFFAAISRHEFFFYLAAVIVIGGAWALLETSANPLIVQMGPPETAVRRLNLAQSFYPVGLLMGVWLGPRLAFSELPLPGFGIAQSVVRPYVIIGLCVLLLAFLVDHIEFPRVATTPSPKGSRARDELRSVLLRRGFPLSLATLASYIVAQSCIWAIILIYVPQASAPFSAADFMLWSWIIYALGRFIGTGLMYVFDSDQLLTFYAAAACVLLALAAVSGGLFAVICLCASSFFMSIMFPTIFGGSIHSLGPLTKSGSGLLVMATGLGVTIAAAIMAFVSSAIAVMAISSLCFAIVFIYGLDSCRKTRHSSSGSLFIEQPPCS